MYVEQEAAEEAERERRDDERLARQVHAWRESASQNVQTVLTHMHTHAHIHTYTHVH